MKAKYVIALSALLSVIGLQQAFAQQAQSVPEVADPANPEVDGQKMTPFTFLKKYCQGTAQDEKKTCDAVSRAMAIKAADGTLPKGW